MTQKKFLVLAATLFICGAFYNVPSLAQANLGSSSDRDVAFAFYKNAEATPNFKRWVEQTEPYSNTPMAMREKVMERELERMKDDFERFNPNEDLLTLRTKVQARLWWDKNSEDEDAFFQYEYVKVRGNEEKVFPFEYGGDKFALVVEDIDAMRELKISKRQLDFYRYELNNSPSGILTAILQLRPKISDINMPYQINSEDPHWLLVTEIASLTFWTPKGNLVHSYTAPWYFSPANREIQALKAKQEKEKDTIEEGLLQPEALSQETPEGTPQETP